MKEIKDLKKLQGYTMFTDRKTQTQHDKESSSLQIDNLSYSFSPIPIKIQQDLIPIKIQ